MLTTLPSAHTQPSQVFALAPTGGTRRRTRAIFIWALALSLVIHLILTLWPYEGPVTPDAIPLTATLTEMPPPPRPTAAPAAPTPPKRKPARRNNVAGRRRLPLPSPHRTSRKAPRRRTRPMRAPRRQPKPTPRKREPEVIAGAAIAAKALPERVDLAYKVYYGTNGFLIGEAVYRFEHHDNRYRIATVGEARGLAALILRGQGKVESRGLITPTGLQPMELNVERGGPDRRETAVFDWEAGLVTLHENKTEALELAHVRPAFGDVGILFFAADRRQPHLHGGDHAPRGDATPSPAKARSRSSGRTARSRRNAGIAAASMAIPMPMSGLRPRSTTCR